jgi:predicted RNA-binding Zn-ribbon protein involved in translation (DUF1610 family)
MVLESCCIVVILLCVVFIVLFLVTKNRSSTHTDSSHPPPPEYIPTYQCPQCGLHFVQPEEIHRNNATIAVCPECKTEIIL